MLLIDPMDEHLLNAHKWHIQRGYYQTNIKIGSRWVTKTLHQLILPGVPSGYVVDHINRNKLDNRRCNLRIISRADNNRNRDLLGEPMPNGRIRVRKWLNGKPHLLGYVGTPEEAQRLADEFMESYFHES